MQGNKNATLTKRLRHKLPIISVDGGSGRSLAAKNFRDTIMTEFDNITISSFFDEFLNFFFVFDEFLSFF